MNKMHIVVLFVVQLVLLLIVTSSTTAVAAAASSTPPPNGTIDTKLNAALVTAFASGDSDPGLARIANTAVTPQATSFHLHLFESLGMGSGYQTYPLIPASVCLAYNPATSTDLLELSIDLIGSWLLATDGGATVTSPRSATSATTASYTIVIAPNSATTRVLLKALVDNSVTGFASTTTLPGGVTGVISVADDDAVAADIKANPGHVGLLPVARGDGLQCAYVRVQDPNTKESRAYLPELPDVVTRYIDLEPGTTQVTVALGQAYPLVGALVATVPLVSPCDNERADLVANFFVSIFTDPVKMAALRLSGFGHFAALTRVEAFRGLLGSGGAAECSHVRRVASGGSSAMRTTVGAWVLEYLRTRRIFVDYVASSSGDGQNGVKNRNMRVAGSDAVLSTKDQVEYPNIKLVPAIALAVSIVFNLPGISQLVLPRCLVPAIFNGSVAMWNHADIVAANPTIKLPSAAIKITVRSTTSGTTEIFMRGLHEIDLACGATAAPAPVTATWPYGSTFSTTNNGDMLNTLRSNAYTLGYAAAPAAHVAASPLQRSLGEAGIIDSTSETMTGSSSNTKNAIVFATVIDVETALASAKLDAATTEVDLFANAASSYRSSWPFTGVSYWLWEDDRASSGDSAIDTFNCTELTHALEFARWASSSEWARQAAVDNSYVPLTANLVAAAEQKIQAARCAGNFLFPQSNADEAQRIAIIASSTVAGFLVLVLVGVVTYRLARSGLRSSEHAAKDPLQPLCVVFTGIECVTSLWSQIPHRMAAILAVHDRVVRDTLQRNKGYEVKTTQSGDSFMLVFKNPENAVCFAGELQQRMMEADWDGGGADGGNPIISSGVTPKNRNSSGKPSRSTLDKQQDKQQQQVATSNKASRKNNKDASKKSSSSCIVDEINAVYEREVQDGLLFGGAGIDAQRKRLDRTLFNGLSIKVGMHYGLCDIRSDNDVWDYHGQTVITAKQITAVAHGGQICVSSDFMSALNRRALHNNNMVLGEQSGNVRSPNNNKTSGASMRSSDNKNANGGGNDNNQNQTTTAGGGDDDDTKVNVETDNTNETATNNNNPNANDSKNNKSNSKSKSESKSKSSMQTHELVRAHFDKTPLGRQLLRGISDPVEIIQLVPLSLKGRVFPPLDLDFVAPPEPDLMTDVLSQQTAGLGAAGWMLGEGSQQQVIAGAALWNIQQQQQYQQQPKLTAAAIRQATSSPPSQPVAGVPSTTATTTATATAGTTGNNNNNNNKMRQQHHHYAPLPPGSPLMNLENRKMLFLGFSSSLSGGEGGVGEERVDELYGGDADNSGGGYGGEHLSEDQFMTIDEMRQRLRHGENDDDDDDDEVGQEIQQQQQYQQRLQHPKTYEDLPDSDDEEDETATNGTRRPSATASNSTAPPGAAGSGTGGPASSTITTVTTTTTTASSSNNSATKSQSQFAASGLQPQKQLMRAAAAAAASASSTAAAPAHDNNSATSTVVPLPGSTHDGRSSKGDTASQQQLLLQQHDRISQQQQMLFNPNAPADVARAEMRFADYLRDRSDPTGLLRLRQVSEHLRIAFATAPTSQARMKLIQTLLDNWRCDEVRNTAHRQFRQALGSEQYWIMRLAARICAVARTQEIRRARTAAAAAATTAALLAQHQYQLLHQQQHPANTATSSSSRSATTTKPPSPTAAATNGIGSKVVSSNITAPPKSTQAPPTQQQQQQQQTLQNSLSGRGPQFVAPSAVASPVNQQQGSSSSSSGTRTQKQQQRLQGGGGQQGFVLAISPSESSGPSSSAILPTPLHSQQQQGPQQGSVTLAAGQQMYGADNNNNPYMLLPNAVPITSSFASSSGGGYGFNADDFTADGTGAPRQTLGDLRISGSSLGLGSNTTPSTAGTGGTGGNNSATTPSGYQAHGVGGADNIQNELSSLANAPPLGLAQMSRNNNNGNRRLQQQHDGAAGDQPPWRHVQQHQLRSSTVMTLSPTASMNSGSGSHPAAGGGGNVGLQSPLSSASGSLQHMMMVATSPSEDQN